MTVTLGWPTGRRRFYAKALAVLCALAPVPQALAEPAAALRAARPDLFHAETGLRIARYRAPTPDAAPGAVRVDAAGAKALLDAGALPLDVGAAHIPRYDELDGSWVVRGPHLSLPGALWLPETGRGTLSEEMARYLADALTTRAGPARPILVFCIADCWMSWNAAQRVAALGYAEVHWFPEGTDGWAEAGLPLAPVAPLPVPVE